MKAIPDLDFAAKQIKPTSSTPSSQNPQSGTGTPEHRTNKPQHKLSGKDGGSRRGSGKMGKSSLYGEARAMRQLLKRQLAHFPFADELSVPRYRTEKPSKSPPPPPPRRSFPSSPGLTTRSGEPLIPGKSIKVREKLHKCSVFTHI